MPGLSDYPVIAVLRAEDLERAKRFYTDQLGLSEATEMAGDGMTMFSAGQGSMFMIYERPGMPAPENTTLGFGIHAEDFDSAVTQLRDAGVMFEDYDMPEIGVKTVNGIAETDGQKTAWFKDSEGNIINIMSV